MKKNFLLGIVVGIVSVIVLNTFYNSISPLYAGIFNKDQKVEDKLNEIVDVLDKNYVNDYEYDNMLEGLYTGFVYGVGDPYTSYMSKDTLARFLEQTEGVYAGIGVVVSVDQKDNSIIAITPYESAPGAKAGILPGDKIIMVNDINVTGDMLDVAVSMMRGKPGTSVKVTVYRESDQSIIEMDIVRENINIPTVSHKVYNDNIGYLRITNFEGVTYDQFVEAYKDLQAQNIKGLVIDLRNNPGGLLDVVTKITDILVPKGFITYIEDKSGKKRYIYSDENKIEIPLLVLVNGNSASASEVLSGAVKDMGIGQLVGTQTFGKGLVQNLFRLSDGSALKITIAKYYTPSGVCIDGEGITPDYIVEMPSDLSIKLGNLSLEEDVQLRRALEIMGEKIEKK